MSPEPEAESVFAQAIAAHLEVVSQMRSQQAELLAIAQLMVKSLRAGGKILWFGNGGSAADSQHLAAEIVGRFCRDRRGLPALALTTDSSILTAVANDYGYEEIFARQVEALGVSGDVLVGISTSGNSPNVVAALQKGRLLGLSTVAFTGAEGGVAAFFADRLISVPSACTARIQEAHILAGHMLCDWIEQDWLLTEFRLRQIAAVALRVASMPAAPMLILEVA
jgi:D-sedoheptulose 7-phosphate isomerase